MSIYETDRYTVVVNTNDKYAVINNQTGVCELETECLPKALAATEEFTTFLNNEVHKKIKYFDSIVNGTSPTDDIFDVFLNELGSDAPAN